MLNRNVRCTLIPIGLLALTAFLLASNFNRTIIHHGHAVLLPLARSPPSSPAQIRDGQVPNLDSHREEVEKFPQVKPTDPGKIVPKDLTETGSNQRQQLQQRARKLPRVAFLFKLHALDDNIRERLQHLRYDLTVAPYREATLRERRNGTGTATTTSAARPRTAALFDYHLVILYDSLVVNASEVAELESMASPQRSSKQPSELRKVTLFPFTGLAMHTAYPTQYPKSDFQAPNSPWKRKPLQGRLRHITHDNPELAYLLWWRSEQDKEEEWQSQEHRPRQPQSSRGGVGHDDDDDDDDDDSNGGELDGGIDRGNGDGSLRASTPLQPFRNGMHTAPNATTTPLLKPALSRWAFVWGCEYDVALAPINWVGPDSLSHEGFGTTRARVPADDKDGVGVVGVRVGGDDGIESSHSVGRKRKGERSHWDAQSSSSSSSQGGPHFAEGGPHSFNNADDDAADGRGSLVGVGGWLDFLEDAMVHDEVMARADILGTMVGWRPWDTWSFGGRINFGKPDSKGAAGSRRGGSGDSDTKDTRSAVYCPLLRFTPNALDLLHRGYSAGRVGYVEVAVATTCATAPSCVMANISSRWLGHFDYRPVVAPPVFREVAKKRPGLLFHPVKYGKPLSSVLIDKAYALQQGQEEEQKGPPKNTSPSPQKKRGEEGERVASHQNAEHSSELSEVPPGFAPFSPEAARHLQRPPARYHPAKYFLSGAHVPWKKGTKPQNVVP